jgi:hypothetical protein
MAMNGFARQLSAASISFRKDENAFLACAAPERLQASADSFQAPTSDQNHKFWFRSDFTIGACVEPNF